MHILQSMVRKGRGLFLRVELWKVFSF